MSTADLIRASGGSDKFYKACRRAASVVGRKWRQLDVDELTSMIAVQAFEDYRTLTKALRRSDDPDAYLSKALYRTGSRVAAQHTYSIGMGAYSSPNADSLDTIEETSFGVPESFYSTNEVRSALGALNMPNQNDPLMDLVIDNMEKLSEKDRSVLVDRFIDGDTSGCRVTVLRAVDRLTRYVNQWGIQVTHYI